MNRGQTLDIDGRRWSFTDFPHKLNLDAYRLAREEYVRRFAGHPAVLAIYEHGRIHNPGVSDLDLLLVLRQGHRRAELGDLLSLPEEAQYVLMDGPWVYDYETFRHIDRIRPPLYGTRFVAGEPVRFQDPTMEPPEKSLVAAFTAFNYITHKILRLGRFLASGEIPVRTMICQVASAAYTRTILADADIPIPEDGPWARGYRLRTDWFDHPVDNNLEALVRCLEDTYAAGFEWAWMLGSRMVEDTVFPREGFGIAWPGLERRVPEGTSLLVNAERSLVFVRERPEFSATLEAGKADGPLDPPPLYFLPESLGGFAALLAQESGPLSDRVRRRFWHSGLRYPLAASPALREQARLLNGDFRAALRGVTTYPVFDYGFPTRPKIGYSLKEHVNRVTMPGRLAGYLRGAG